MAPRVPSDKVLESALEDAVQGIFDSAERDQLTVNYVRQVAEKKLGLEDGFFKTGDWKARSKEVARKAVDKAEAEALNSQQSTASPKPDSDVDAESEPTPKPKPRAKPKPKAKPEPKQKPKPKSKAKPIKKRKAATSDDESDSVSSDLSDISDASDSDISDSDISDSDASSSAQSSDSAPKRKRGRTKAVGRGKKRKSATDDEEDDDSSASDSEPKHPRKKKVKSEGAPKPAPKGKGKPKEQTPVPDPASGSESPLSDAPTRESAEAEPVAVAKVGTPILDEESEMSEVFDELPKRKGKSGAKATKGERKTKAPAKSAAADFSGEGALIRQLQVQLNKCGVRKVWGVLLKTYGDDKRAKIQHLKGMLSDVGMVGRFSESRAREIKERRELMADLDEVKEGEKSWGLTTSARPTRRAAAAAKPRKVSSSESGDEEENPGGAKAGTGSGRSDDDESDDSSVQAKPRARGSTKHRAALAFLGNDSESE